MAIELVPLARSGQPPEAVPARARPARRRDAARRRRGLHDHRARPAPPDHPHVHPPALGPGQEPARAGVRHARARPGVAVGAAGQAGRPGRGQPAAPDLRAAAGHPPAAGRGRRERAARHRDAARGDQRRPGGALTEAIEARTPDAENAGRPGQVWAACEALAVRDIRAHLLGPLGFDRDHILTRGYWRAGEANHPDHDYGEDAV